MEDRAGVGCGVLGGPEGLVGGGGCHRSNNIGNVQNITELNVYIYRERGGGGRDSITLLSHQRN